MQENNVTVLKKGVRVKNRYVIDHVLGQGGFGITYSGYDERLKTKVAIKEFFPHELVTRNNEYDMSVMVTQPKYKKVFETEKKKFYSEADILAGFRMEQGVVSVNNICEDYNTVYIIMELLEGLTLKSYLAQNGVFSVEKIFQLTEPLLDTLEMIHQKGLIHRDISPDNIMILNDGRVKLMDFGNARKYSMDEIKSMSVVIKYGYAPFEQYNPHGEQGPWTDVYAFAATFYECITGVAPVESMWRISSAKGDPLKPPSALHIPIKPAVERVLMKGLAVYPNDRYQSIARFHEALRLALKEPDRGKKDTDQSYSSYTERAPVEVKRAGAGGDRARNVHQLSDEEMREQFKKSSERSKSVSRSNSQWTEQPVKKEADVPMIALIVLGILTAVFIAVLTVFILMIA